MEKTTRKLNVGLIITACLFLTAGLWEIIEMIVYPYYDFSYFDNYLYFFTDIQFLLSFIFFGLYIFLGYKENKKLFGIISILCLAFYNLFWFVQDMYYMGVDLQYLNTQSVFMYSFNILRSMIEVVSFIIMLIMVSKRNKIGTIVMAIIPIFMCLISPLVNYIIFSEFSYNLAYWLLYLIEMSLFLLFAIFAFSEEKKEKVDEKPAYTNNFGQVARPVVNSIPQPMQSAPVNKTTPVQQYNQSPVYTTPPKPQYVPVTQVQNAKEQEVVAQLKLIKQQFEAGQITEDTYNTLKNQLISKL